MHKLRRSEIDYRLSIAYVRHPDFPTIPIALHELKRGGSLIITIV